MLLGAMFFLLLHHLKLFFVCAAKIDKVTGNTVCDMSNIITSNISFLLIELLYESIIILKAARLYIHIHIS